MPYGPNTSRTSRLPHGFFEKLYENIHIAEDMLNAYEQDPSSVNMDLYVGMLRKLTAELKRQRGSHLGNETL